MDTDLLTAKLVTTFLFFILTGVACLLPLLVRRLAVGTANVQNNTRVQKIINGLNFVAGGVFLGTILLHLLPDVHDDLTTALIAYGMKTSYPVPEFVVAAGLLFFLLLEQTVLAFQSKGEQFKTKVVKFDEGNGENKELTSKDSNYKALENSTSTTEKTDSDNAKDDSTLPEINGDFVQTASILRSYALLIALSVHSVFEGMVVGFQDMPTTVWELFAAIIMHKLLVAFSFGTRLLAAKHSISVCHYVGLLTVFTSMCPIGCGIGTVMTAGPDSAPMNLAEAIMVGLATGSFMFVTFFEIIRFEGGRKTNLFMCVLVILGFAAIALEILSHRHSHAEGQLK